MDSKSFIGPYRIVADEVQIIMAFHSAREWQHLYFSPQVCDINCKTKANPDHQPEAVL